MGVFIVSWYMTNLVYDTLYLSALYLLRVFIKSSSNHIDSYRCKLPDES